MRGRGTLLEKGNSNGNANRSAVTKTNSVNNLYPTFVKIVLFAKQIDTKINNTVVVSIAIITVEREMCNVITSIIFSLRMFGHIPLAWPLVPRYPSWFRRHLHSFSAMPRRGNS